MTGRATLRSVNDARQLDGLSLADAFRQLVLNDSEVQSLAPAVIRQGAIHQGVFRDGRYPGIFGPYEWPLNLSTEELEGAFTHTANKHPKIDPIRCVSQVLVQRIQKLKDLLFDGVIVARGTWQITGEVKVIDRLQWARHNIYIDVRNSDLLEEENNKKVRKWCGIAFEVRDLSAAAQPSDPNRVAVPSGGRRSSQRESIDAAVDALWKGSVPARMPIQVRNYEIARWLQDNKKVVASERTIRRYFGRK